MGELERCGVLLEGAAAGTGALALSPPRAARGLAQALAAIEIALLDLAGKLAGEPAWRLLGAGERGRSSATRP